MALEAQWVRICQCGSWVRPLVWDDPTRLGATEPRGPQALKHVRLELVLCKRGRFSLPQCEVCALQLQVAPPHWRKPENSNEDQLSQK